MTRDSSQKSRSLTISGEPQTCREDEAGLEHLTFAKSQDANQKWRSHQNGSKGHAMLLYLTSSTASLHPPDCDADSPMIVVGASAIFDVQLCDGDSDPDKNSV